MDGLTILFQIHGADVPDVFMMTSSNGKIAALLAICAENSPVSGEFPAQRPVTRSFDVLFDLCLNKRLRKQSWGWWFETLSHPLWRHCNEMAFLEPFVHSPLMIKANTLPLTAYK